MINMEQRKYGFSPIFDQNSRILIVGTFPSERSLADQEYYAYPRNQFWQIVAVLFQENLPQDYSGKKRLLQHHNLALWDVYASCVRENSSGDDQIKAAKVNDFSGLIEHTKISCVVADSQKAFSELWKQKDLLDSIGIPVKNLLVVPSPSPANARYSVTQKIAMWQDILQPFLLDQA